MKSLNSHEKALIQFFPLSQPICIFDIGAFNGRSGKRYLEIFPNGRLYSYEPLPENFEKVLHTLSVLHENQWTARCKALSDRKGKAIFHVSTGKPKPEGYQDDYGKKSSSLLQPELTREIYPWLLFEEKIEVQTETLESEMNDLGIAHIDFLHMDVQGAELMVLQGAGSRLQDIKSIWLEVEKIELYRKQALERDLYKFFRAQNFKKILNETNHIAGDQLWINQSLWEELSFWQRSNFKLVSFFSDVKSGMRASVGSLRFRLQLGTKLRRIGRLFFTKK